MSSFYFLFYYFSFSLLFLSELLFTFYFLELLFTFYFYFLSELLFTFYFLELLYFFSFSFTYVLFLVSTRTSNPPPLPSLLVRLFSVCAVVPIFITLLGCGRISGHVPQLFILFNFFLVFLCGFFILLVRVKHRETLYRFLLQK